MCPVGGTVAYLPALLAYCKVCVMDGGYSTNHFAAYCQRGLDEEK